MGNSLISSAEQTNKPKRKTRTSSEVIKRYKKKVYSRIYAELPKELVADFKAAAKRNGVSVASVFKEAMTKYIEENRE